MSTGILMPFESAAMRGDDLPDGLNLPDQVLFLSLRSLYWQVRKGVVDRERAVAEKKKLLNAHRVQCFNRDLWENAARRERKIEHSITEVLKDQELMQNQKVRSLISAIDGIKR